MIHDPSCLDHLEILQLLAIGLSDYIEQLLTEGIEPFPYPEALLRGFNLLCLACTMQDISRSQRPTTIHEFILSWAVQPLSEWSLKLELPAELVTGDERLLDPDFDSRPTQFCQKLSQRTWLQRNKLVFIWLLLGCCCSNSLLILVSKVDSTGYTL